MIEDIKNLNIFNYEHAINAGNDVPPPAGDNLHKFAFKHPPNNKCIDIRLVNGEYRVSITRKENVRQRSFTKDNLSELISLLDKNGYSNPVWGFGGRDQSYPYVKVPIDRTNSFVSAIGKIFGDTERPNIVATNTQDHTVEKNMHINVIKYGPPGTGKTYSLVNDVLEITEYNLPPESNIHDIIRHGKHENNFKRVEFVTFHQSYSYEEFVEGIRAEVINSQVSYKVHNGIFKRLCRRAYFHKVKSLVNSEQKVLFSDSAQAIYEKFPFELLRKHNPDLTQLLLDYESKEVTKAQKENIPKFVLCIDEINRANISRVFGELITLIEDTKRQGAEETISVTLPYSGDEFFVPDNLYILGTMNTADRSLAKLDLALRRRFHFEAYYPDLEQVKNFTAKDILKRLNEFIIEKLDREHTIGHSYLMSIEKDATGDTLNEALAHAFTGKIVPLLEEYFLHEPTKVQEAKTVSGISDYVANN